METPTPNPAPTLNPSPAPQMTSYPKQSCVVMWHPTRDGAYAAALAQSKESNGLALEGTFSKQGNRQVFNTTVTFGMVFSRVSTVTPKTIDELAKSENRPQIDKHVKDIVSYLEDRIGGGHNYILPPIVVGAKDASHIHAVTSGGAAVYAVMVLPQGAMVAARDGYHRTTAVKEVVMAMPSCASETIGAMVMFDTSLDTVHQDLVDIAQARPMARAVFTTWRGNPIDRFCAQLLQSSPFLAQVVEPMNDGFTPTSDKLITRSGLQYGVTDFCSRRGRERLQVTERMFERQVGDEGSPAWQALHASFVDCVDLFAQANPEWDDMRRRPMNGKGRVYRESNLHCKNVGWRALCQAFCAILDQAPDRRSELIAKLAGHDWTASNPQWQRLGIVHPKTNLKTGAVTHLVDGSNPKIETLATYVIGDVLGLDVTRPEIKTLDRRPCGARTTKKSKMRRAVEGVKPVQIVAVVKNGGGA